MAKSLNNSSDYICQFLISREAKGTKDTLFYDLKLFFRQEYSLVQGPLKKILLLQDLLSVGNKRRASDTVTKDLHVLQSRRLTTTSIHLRPTRPWRLLPLLSVGTPRNKATTKVSVYLLVVAGKKIRPNLDQFRCSSYSSDLFADPSYVTLWKIVSNN